MVDLNTDEGYKVNPVTGDSIQVLINSWGDTIRTGVPIPARGIVIDPATVLEPTVVPAGVPRKLPARRNIHNIPKDLPTKAVRAINLLDSSLSTEQLSDFVLRNAKGDTLSTGIPIPVEGRKVPCIQPQTIASIPPGIMDNASMDIKYLDAYHGLISSQVISMMEDMQGNIWFGSTGGGATRYDGKTMSHFTGENGLSDSWITSMLMDSKGRLWFGTLGEGVILFDGDSFTHITEREGLSNNTIEDILEDSEGNMWFGTSGGGVCRYDGKSLVHYTIKEGLSNNRVLAILEDSKGNLWLGTGNGISMFDGEVFRKYTSEEGPDDYIVTSVLEDRQGNLWFGTSGGGARVYDGETYTYFTEKEGLSHNNVDYILEDSNGNIWFGTAGGACLFRDDTFTHFTETEGISGNWIISILEDSSGNLWFGSIGDGVSIFNGQSFKYFAVQDGLSSRAIQSMLEDSRGNLWLGTMFGGVSMYDGVSYTHYTEKEGLNHNTVESILEDSHGNLWFGLSSNGVSKYSGNSFTHFTEKEGFSNFSTGSMLEDVHGNIWFGTYGDGVIMYNGNSFMHYSEKEGLSNKLVESILEDSQGNLWFGTLGGGVSRFDGETFTHFTEKEGLSSNLVGSIMEDRHGNLWFGTMTGGVCRYDGDSFTIFTEKVGLNDNRVQSIVEDDKGNIWISTYQGLNLIEFEERDSSVNIISFGVQDGLQGIHFLQNSVLLDSKNQLWWGSNRSLTQLDLDAFEIAKKPPLIHLNRLDINGAFLDYRSLERDGGRNMNFSSISPFYNYPLDLKLSFNENHLSFHFSAIDWSAPHHIWFSYRIKGLDKSWSTPSEEAKADYRNLPYGTHTFEVKAIGEAKIWSDPLEYNFTINPPWWHRWWARAGYGILGLLLISGIIQWRTSSLKKRQKELENTVRDRTLEISEKNDELELQNENLASQRDEIQEQKKAITDSIEYAKRIQTATLPPDELLKNLLPKHFILYKPLQIVSGDFYWLTRKKDKIIVAVADCTGHGVPGAFMSMLGSALLNDIVADLDVLQANLVLNELRDRVILSLRQTGEADEARDGMDISLCIIHRELMQVQYAGAHNPLYLIREGNLTEVKADMMPIGISPEARGSFTNHQLALRKDDTLYLFTDGYVDQFGGERRKRFMTSRLKSLLIEIQKKSMSDQQAILENTLHEWMGLTGLYDKAYEQIDDIVVMGIKI